MIDTFPHADYFGVKLNLINTLDKMKAKCSSETSGQIQYTAPYKHPQDHRMSNTFQENPEII
jgi:hypothetical protein